MTEPYPIHYAGEEGLFHSAAGVPYVLLFREEQRAFFPLLPQMRGHVFSFAFFPLAEPGAGIVQDERIMLTIVNAVREKFKDKQNVVVFIVDDSDERQDVRWRRFESLYKAAQDTGIELLSGAVMKGRTAVMSALLIHHSNPFLEELKDQFFELLARLSKD